MGNEVNRFSSLSSVDSNHNILPSVREACED